VAYYEAALAVLNGKVEGVQPAVGWALLQKAVQLGDPAAQFLTGSLYITGQATGTKDYATALPLIEKAAQGGHVDAQFMAANFYKEGIGGARKDAKKAFDYYRQAAERGHIYAAYLAAYMVNDGDGIKADHVMAYRLARNLADQGQVVGAVIAASALLQQKNAKDNENEVLYWMDVAIRDGDQNIRDQVSKMRPQVVAAFKRANAPPEYHPRVRKICGKKTVCLVNSFTGLQSCTTNTDYWSDCDTVIPGQ
jgi:TPR repeat protein